MVSKLIYFFIGAVILSSCAQVGSISGGPKDETAPEIKSMSPENKSLNFSGNGFEIEFQDFIKLNSPTQTISVIPPDFKVKTAVKGKTLFLSWDESLKANTTYSIFLNQTVQDITENNDSIIQLVFSTGNVLDSLTYSTLVQDGSSMEPSKKITVGLFEAVDSLKPMYFAQTDNFGRANFNYVKEGSYFVRAFDDVNKDLQISKTEKVGFIENPVYLDTSKIDSIPFKLFTPTLAPKISGITFQSPGAFIIAANRSLKDAEIKANGNIIDEQHKLYFRDDSLRMFIVPTEINPTQFTVHSADFEDTINVRILENAKNKSLIIQGPKGNMLVPSDTLRYSVYDAIAIVDTSKISILQLPDSTILHDYTFDIDKNSVIFNFPRKTAEKFIIDFNQGAIIGAGNTASEKLNSTLKVLKEKELGVLNVDISNYSDAIVLQVYLAGKLVKEQAIAQPSKIKLIDLTPGDYTFHVILDRNGNGKWDTGNFEEKIQPEEIQLYSEPTKVRANWEIELQIVPKN